MPDETPASMVLTESNGHQPGDNLVLLGRDTSTAGARGDPFAPAKRRCAIIGFAPSSLKIAIDTVMVDPTWRPDNPDMPSEIWGLNELYKIPGISHAERWFDIHDRRDGDISLRDPGNIDFLRKATIPVFMQEHYDDIPSSIRYPVEQVTHHFRTNYFTNSISFELALAIIEGRDERGWVIDPEKAYGEIRVYGVDMAQDAAAYSEYREQRPSVEYFLGWARAIGIKTHVPAESDLLKTNFMYGYEGTGAGLKAKFNARRAELQNQIAVLQQQAQAKMNEANQLTAKSFGAQGALENMTYVDRAFLAGPEPYTVKDGKLVTIEGLAVYEDKKPEPVAPAAAST